MIVINYLNAWLNTLPENDKAFVTIFLLFLPLLVVPLGFFPLLVIFNLGWLAVRSIDLYQRLTEKPKT